MAAHGSRQGTHTHSRAFCPIPFSVTAKNPLPFLKPERQGPMRVFLHPKKYTKQRLPRRSLKKFFFSDSCMHPLPRLYFPRLSDFFIFSAASVSAGISAYAQPDAPGVCFQRPAGRSNHAAPQQAFKTLSPNRFFSKIYAWMCIIAS